MKYLKRLSWGIVIYAILYLTWSGFAAYGFTAGIAPRLCELVVLVIVATIAGRSLHFNSWKDIIPYSFGWAVIAFAIDTILTLPFSGLAMYSNWNLWVGYALVMLLPLAAPQTRVFVEETPSSF